jgi:hypothetical protein
VNSSLFALVGVSRKGMPSRSEPVCLIGIESQPVPASDLSQPTAPAMGCYGPAAPGIRLQGHVHLRRVGGGYQPVRKPPA